MNRATEEHRTRVSRRDRSSDLSASSDADRIAGQLVDRASDALAPIVGDRAALEAQVLLAHAIGVDRSRLLAELTEHVSDDAVRAFDALLARRLSRKPLAYIVEHREFYGIEIACSPAALIPRPETEMLVDLALEEIERRTGVLRVCDVGTGTGAIAVAIATHAAHARITGTDTSHEALELALENARRHGAGDRIDLRRADLLDGLGAFDVIVANLPYVSEDEWRTLEPEIRDHEPRSALVGGPTGVEIIERFLREAPPHLYPGGALAIEIGATQGARATRLARATFPKARIELMRDLAGLDRVVAVYAREDE